MTGLLRGHGTKVSSGSCFPEGCRFTVRFRVADKASSAAEAITAARVIAKTCCERHAAIMLLVDDGAALNR